MFDGVPADQFHQFIASSRTSLPIPLSFPLHHHHHHHHGGVPSAQAAAVPPPPVIAPTPVAPPPPSAFLACFDLYPSHHHHQILEVVQQPHPHQQQHHGGLHPQLHHHHPHPSPPPPPTDTSKDEKEEEEGSISVGNNNIRPSDDLWSNDEVLTLLRIRSNMENWFPEFTWEHVSRKLGEHGYQRSAEKCKEKFEEESRNFNSMGYSSKNYRFFSDLDELYDHDDDDDHDNPPQVSNDEKGQQDLVRKERDHHQQDQEVEDNNGDPMIMSSTRQREETENTVALAAAAANKEPTAAAAIKESESARSTTKKRKRKQKFDMFKGFCEAVVKRIVSQQEDLHNKLIEDMLKRDEECIAREEAWKCQEMDRVNKEIEMRAREQAMAGDRQAKIIDLLKKFTSGSGSHRADDDHDDPNLIRRIEDFFKVRKSSSSSSPVTSSSEILPPNPIETGSSRSRSRSRSNNNISHQNPSTFLPTSSSETTPSPHNHHSSTPPPPPVQLQPQPTPNSQIPNKKIPHTSIQENPSSNSTPSFASEDQRVEKLVGGGAGKRWPRDEVQALINLKCSTQTTTGGINNGGDHDVSSKEGGLPTKGPLWERISQGMLELGYKRSAKRCKEKWENINKYFRKTKDSNKKRPAESRTCPYFHQLSTLYGSQGTTLDVAAAAAANSDAPENYPASPDGCAERD